ncbi:MAG: hypothetical protein ACYDBH_02965 [Acidobacteriaceae bacterium]
MSTLVGHKCGRPDSDSREQGWRRATVTIDKRAAGSQSAALEAIDKRVRAYIITQWAPYLAGVQLWRAWKPESGGRPPRPDCPAPIMIEVTTGVGKTEMIRRIKELCTSLGIPTLVLVPNHLLSAGYVSAGWRLYHGRGAVGQQQQDWDCQMHNIVKKLTAQNHFPQSAFCVHHCQHGRKWVIDTANKGSPREANARTWFRLHDIDHTTVEPCRWQGHLREMMRTMHVVAAFQALSDSLLVWAQTLVKRGQIEGDDVPRLLIIDESVEVSNEIPVSLESLAEWSGQIRGLLDAADTTGDQAMREALESALEIFQRVSRWLGENATVEHSGAIPDDLREQVGGSGKSKRLWDGSTAVWEHPVFPKARDPLVPLRAARAIVTTLGVGAGRMTSGRLRVVQITQVGEFLASGKAGIVLDATLPTELRAAGEASRKRGEPRG